MYKVAFIYLIALALLASQKLSAQTTSPRKKLVVAVVDTGIDLYHPRLKPFLWGNSGEQGLDAQGKDKSSNGIDDDNNGYIDDLHGWNFARSSHDILDRHGHGTHISGLITQDLAPDKVTLMTLKYFDPKATGAKNMSSFVESLEYALKMGAQVINISGGGPSFSEAEFKILSQAQKKGIVICAASGNDGKDVSDRAFYPASYKLSNIISTASVGPGHRLLASSNYGDKVDFAAPGLDQISTLPGSTHGPMTGSSQATANLCGLVAELLVNTPDLSVEAISKKLESTGVWEENLYLKTRTATVPDRERVLQMKDTAQDAFGRRLPSSFPKSLNYGG